MTNKAIDNLTRRQTRVFKEEAVDHMKRVRYYSTAKIKNAPADRSSLLDAIHSKIKNPLNIRRIDSIYERTQRQENPNHAYEPQWLEQE